MAQVVVNAVTIKSSMALYVFEDALMLARVKGTFAFRLKALLAILMLL